MTSTVRQRFRPFLLVGLAAFTLLLGGCVYLRLLQLKLQLGDFEKNFTVDTRDGLALGFNHPVILDEDVEKFFHWVPDTRQRSGTAEKWQFGWLKQPAAGDPAQPPVEIHLELYFADHKLIKLFAPENFFAASLPKSLALAGLRSLGHAAVDKEKRQASSTIGSRDLQDAATDKFLSKPGLLAALGKPTKQAAKEGGLEEWRYEFAPISQRQRFGDSGTIDVTFTIDAASGKVRVMKGHTMFGAITFDTTNVGPGATGTMNTALEK